MIFADASIYIGRRRHAERERAESILSRIRKGYHGKGVTSVDILDEVISYSHKKIKGSTPAMKKEEMKKIDEEIEDSVFVEFHLISNNIRNNAKALLQKYPGTATLTDFTSALLMKELGIKKIASFDSEFNTIFSLPEFKDFPFEERVKE